MTDKQMEVGRIFSAGGSSLFVNSSDIKTLEIRMKALEEQVQSLPEKVVTLLLRDLHLIENQCAEQACQAVLALTSKQNSTGSCAE